MGQRTDRIFGAKPGGIGKSAPICAEITIRKSQLPSYPYLHSISIRIQRRETNLSRINKA